LIDYSTLSLEGEGEGKGKDKCVPVHAIKRCRSEGLAPFILDFGAWWKWVVRLTPRPL